MAKFVTFRKFDWAHFLTIEVNNFNLIWKQIRVWLLSEFAEWTPGKEIRNEGQGDTRIWSNSSNVWQASRVQRRLREYVRAIGWGREESFVYPFDGAIGRLISLLDWLISIKSVRKRMFYRCDDTKPSLSCVHKSTHQLSIIYASALFSSIYLHRLQIG